MLAWWTGVLRFVCVCCVMQRESPANIGWTQENCCVPLFALTLRDGFVGVQLKKEKQEATALGDGETRSSVKVIPAAQRRVQKGHPPPAFLPFRFTCTTVQATDLPRSHVNSRARVTPAIHRLRARAEPV